MAAVLAGEAEVEKYLRGREGEVAIAAVNGPGQVVISGAREAVERVWEALGGRG